MTGRFASLLAAAALVAAAASAGPAGADQQRTVPAASPPTVAVAEVAAQPGDPAAADLGWLLAGHGALTCGKWVNHVVCHKMLPDIQPPQVEAWGAVEPWLPPGDCQNFALKPGDNQGRPAELTVYGKGFGWRGCVPGDPQSVDRGFCLLTITAAGDDVCDYAGANLTHLPGVTVERVDVFRQPQFGWSWGTRFLIP